MVDSLFERMKRRAAKEHVRSSVSPGVTLCRNPITKLMNQTRLADSGLAYNQHGLALAHGDPIKTVHKHPQFIVTSNEGRDCASGARQAIADPRWPNRADQFERLSDAFQRPGAQILKQEQSTDQMPSCGCNHDCPRLGDNLHPRRNVRRISEDIRHVVSTFTYHRRPGVDS